VISWSFVNMMGASSSEDIAEFSFDDSSSSMSTISRHFFPASRFERRILVSFFGFPVGFSFFEFSSNFAFFVFGSISISDFSFLISVPVFPFLDSVSLPVFPFLASLPN